MLANRGHIIGHASAEVYVLRRHPDGSETELIRDSISTQPVAIDPAVTRDYPLVGFTATEWGLLQKDTPRQVLIVKGTYFYDDGFGDNTSNQFCYSFYSQPPVILKRQSSSGSTTFTECSTWQGSRDAFLREQREEREEQTQK